MALLFLICGPGRGVTVLPPGADFFDKALLMLFELVLTHFQGNDVLSSSFVSFLGTEAFLF